MKTISEYIKVQRNLKNLKQTELASFAEVNINTIVKVEKDASKTSVETLTKILDVLGLDLVVVPKADAKMRFLDTHYPHFKETGMTDYLYRMIVELDKRRSMTGVTKNKDVMEYDTERFITRLYDPKLKTEEGQKTFYLALRALPDVTRKMSEEHILFWRVESLDVVDNNITFTCTKSSVGKKDSISYLPIPESLRPSGTEDVAQSKMILQFLTGLSPKERIQMVDLFSIEEKEIRQERMTEYLKAKGLDDEAINTILEVLDKNSFKSLI